MTLGCRSCLSQNQKKYFSLLTVFPELGGKSVLELINFVTSLEITYSENLPCDICMACFRNLKCAYNFIILFKNSQAYLQKDAQQLSKEDSKIDSLTALSSTGTERIVIVNDLRSYLDVVHEIVVDKTTKETRQDSKKKTSLEKNSQRLPKEGSKVDNLKAQREANLITISDPEVMEEIVIISEDGNSYIDLIQEDEDQIPKDEQWVLKKKEIIESMKGNKAKKTCKNITLVSVDDILKQKCSSEPKVDEEHNYSSINIEENEDLTQYILEMEKNREKNLNNIQIVTIDDVINTDRKKRGEKKSVMSSVEDVLTAKPKTKKKKTAYDLGIYPCTICNKLFEKRRQLVLHKAYIHNPNWKEKYKCKICGEHCKTMSGHLYHLAKHENKSYPCQHCGKSYIIRSSLREHVKNVHENKLDRKYLCTHCGKYFKYWRAFDYHMKKHTNSKDFICGYCGAAFILATTLKRHERIHTGERPYECKYCKKTFAGCVEKRQHELGHEGVFKYHCKYCSKPFKQTYNMRIHWLQHGGPYVCDICKKNFADADILKFHYTHSHKIKDVVIEEVEEKEGDELTKDTDEDLI